MLLKATATLFSAVLLFYATVVSGATSDEVLQKGKTPTYLFALENNNGTLETLDSSKVKLTLPISSMSHILMFSDRPFRIAKYITDTELEKFWSEKGSNSFEDDPPNAAILINDEIFDIQLTSIEISDSKVIFHGKKNEIEGKQTKHKCHSLEGKIYIFIDTFKSWLKGNSPTFPG